MQKIGDKWKTHNLNEAAFALRWGSQLLLAKDTRPMYFELNLNWLTRFFFKHKIKLIFDYQKYMNTRRSLKKRARRGEDGMVFHALIDKKSRSGLMKLREKLTN